MAEREVTRLATVALDVRTRVDAKPLGDVPSALRSLGLDTQSQECFWVLTYDAAMNLRTVVEVARGAYSRVRVEYPTIYSAVLAAGADRFMVAHNHPTGTLKPTVNDINLTVGIMQGANAVGLYFEDHWIITPGGGAFSFAANGLLNPATYGEAGQEAASL